MRLRGELKGFRLSLFAFYLVSIPANLIMFFLVRETWCVVVATILGNLAIIFVGVWYLRKLPFTRITRRHIDFLLHYGAPLVGERMIQRAGLAVYGVCASYLPAELYAIHSVCLQAVYTGGVGDAAYSAALLVLVPDKEKEECSRGRYLSERVRMIVYRRKTAWLAVFFSFAASYMFAFASHAEAPLGPVMWFTFFYAFSFIIMCSSTPGKDFLTIQKQPKKIMFSTFCGVPAYIVLPIVAVAFLPPEAALYVFGLTGTVQIGVGALLYNRFIHKLDEGNNVTRKELMEQAAQVKLSDFE